jgi:hypothetical protein
MPGSNLTLKSLIQNVKREVSFGGAWVCEMGEPLGKGAWLTSVEPSSGEAPSWTGSQGGAGVVGNLV